MADATTELTAESDLLNAPDTGKPMTERQGADSIAALLDADPSILDPGDDEKPSKESAPKKPAEEEDPLGDDDEDVAETEDDEIDDTPAQGGKFVSDAGKIKMPDGRTISVGELKGFVDTRVKEMQRDYSGKSEALSVKTKEVDQLLSTAAEERKYVRWYAETYMPQPPIPPDASVTVDPMAHLEYQEKVRQYNVHVQAWQQFKQSEDADVERKTGETQKEATDRATREVQTLFAKVKIDPASPKAAQFFDAIEKGAKEFYGLSADQIATFAKTDHRTMLVLRDAIRANRNKKAVPEVEGKLKAAPKMLRGPTARQSGDARQGQVRAQSKEKLRQTGSFNDGVAAIEALIS